MRDVMIAALLSGLVWPGAGQFFNRDFKKGAVLTGLTILLSLALMIGLGRDVARLLPPNPNPFDPAQISALKDGLVKANPVFYGRYSLLLSLTWLFGVVDAVLGARERSRAGAVPGPRDSADEKN